MPVVQKPIARTSETNAYDDRLRELLRLHLHPRHGSAYWLEREATLGWSVCDRVRTTADLRQLGPTDLGALRERSVRDFIPRAFHRRLSRFIIGETAGTSGRPCTTAYRKDEFEAAFIDPFLRVAEAARFPRNAPWLWVGPSGPHIIGKVVRELACRMGNIDPFSVDFDPRWAKRLTAGSLGRQRYLDHVIAQATDILEREEIGVIFTTPPTLTALAQALTDRQREYVQGVHYGGLSVTPEAVNEFRRMFPNAVHLSGYGNTLFGVVMEAMDEPRTAMDYFPLGDRLLFEVVRGADDWPMEPSQLGERGRVMFHRFDESALLVNVVERDEAELVPVSPQARRLGGRQPGIRNPKAPAALENRLQHGLY